MEKMKFCISWGSILYQTRSTVARILEYPQKSTLTLGDMMLQRFLTEFRSGLHARQSRKLIFVN